MAVAVVGGNGACSFGMPLLVCGLVVEGYLYVTITLISVVLNKHTGTTSASKYL